MKNELQNSFIVVDASFSREWLRVLKHIEEECHVEWAIMFAELLTRYAHHITAFSIDSEG